MAGHLAAIGLGERDTLASADPPGGVDAQCREQGLAGVTPAAWQTAEFGPTARR